MLSLGLGPSGEVNQTTVQDFVVARERQKAERVVRFLVLLGETMN